MTDETYYRDISFVDDHPSSSDEFRGQPHNSVAGTLVSILSSGDGGRAIGLEGTWGSGKSTVIDIAQLKLHELDRDCKDGQRHTFFVFDAWAHQSDPLRRVFLQELIQYLDSNNAVDKVYWNKQLEKLETLRKKITETKDEKLSAVAKAAVISVPFYPIAYILINKNDSSLTLDLPIIGHFCLPFWFLGTVIVLFPFIVAAFTWLMWRNGWRTSRNIFYRSWWRTKEAMRGKSIIWAFTRQTDHVTTEQLIREEEATTVEFNAIFDDLINDAAKHNHRVIIVFDNLDRLPPDLIQSAWATMRNFFATTPGTPRQSALRNVWLIVPFDRAHIEAVFEKDKKGETNEATPGFIEKTFEIVLRVAPPILSNWRDFLSRKLGESFGSRISEHECYQIFKVFDLHCRLKHKVITPRAIKAFVNTIVAQAKQWGTLIPLEHQALFAIYKEEIKNNIGKLQDSSVVNTSIRSQISDSNWVKSLAAAHYNVHPDEALELLLATEIAEAIRKNDSVRLAVLQKTSGFSVVLDDYISQTASEWAGENPAVLFDASATLANLSLDDEAVKLRIWRTMRSQISGIAKPIDPTDQTASGIEALMSYSPPAESKATARGLVRAVSLERVSLPTAADDAGKTWYSILSAIKNSLPADLPVKEHEEIFSKIPIQTNIPYLLSIAEAAGAPGEIPFSAFQLSDSPEDIANSLVTFIKADTPPKPLDAILNAFIVNPGYQNWAPVVGAIQTRLQTPKPPLSSPDAYRLLTLLDAMKTKKLVGNLASKVIKTLNDDGSLHGVLGIARRDNDMELTSLVLHQLMVHRTGSLDGPESHPQYGALAEANKFLSEFQSSPNDDTLIDNLAQRAINTHRFFNVLRAGLPKDDNLEFYRAVLRQIVKLGTYRRLNAADVMTETDRIADILGRDLIDKLLQRFDDWNINDEIAEDKWMTIDPKFLLFSAPLTTKHYRRTVDAISAGLSTLTKDQWVSILATEDNTLDLVFTLMDLGEYPKLKESFYDALKSHTQTLADGTELPKKFSVVWSELAALLPSARRRQYFKWLRDRLIDKGPTADRLRAILALFGTEFSSNADFPERAEDIVRVFIDPILAEGITESIASIEMHAEAFADTFKSASDADKDLVSNRMTALYEAGDADEKTRIDSLATTLRLTIEKPEQQSEPQNTSVEPRATSDSSKSTE